MYNCLINAIYLEWLYYDDFSCRDNNPLRDVFAIAHPAGVTTVTPTNHKVTELEEKCNSGQLTMMYSEDAGTQIIQHQDSLTDYCSISSDCSVELLGSDSSSITGLGSLASHSSVPLSADQEETSREPEHQAFTDPESYLDSADSVNHTQPQLQAFTVLPVNGTLWIPRYKTEHSEHISYTVVMLMDTENLDKKYVLGCIIIINCLALLIYLTFIFIYFCLTICYCWSKTWLKHFIFSSLLYTFQDSSEVSSQS